jgi:hypothetical protein
LQVPVWNFGNGIPFPYVSKKTDGNCNALVLWDFPGVIPAWQAAKYGSDGNAVPTKKGFQIKILSP